MTSFSGIAICVPTSGRPVDPRWALSLPCLGFPVGMNISWCLNKDSDRARNRETMVEHALASGAQFIFFMDDDTVCPNFGLQYLFYALNQEPQAAIAAGIYCTKEPIPSPLIFEKIGGGPKWDWKVSKSPGDYLDVEGVGAGCMLIRASVFARISRPWFQEPDISFVDKVTNINGIDCPIMRETGTDDLYFCRKVVEAGYRVLAHRAVLPVHIGQDGVAYTLPVDSFPCRDVELATVGA